MEKTKETKKRIRAQSKQNLEEPDSGWNSLSDESVHPPAKQPRKRVTVTKVSGSKSTAAQQEEDQKPLRPIKNKQAKGINHQLDTKYEMHRIILWMRNDLRLHDNPVLEWAAKHKSNKFHTEILPVYCFDPRFYERYQPHYEMKKCGLIRTRFNIETANHFRNSLQAIGSDLYLAHEKPEDFIAKLVETDSPKIKTTIVYQQEITSEELRVEDQLIATITKKNPAVDFVSIWGSTLHHIDDLPYNPIQYFPHAYGYYRKKQADVKVRPLLATPLAGELPLPGISTKDEVTASKFEPKLEDFGFTEEEITKKWDSRACYKFVGGENNGLNRLEEYVFKTRSVAHYDDTRNNLIGANYSSKLSPWLQNGSLSCRQVYWRVKEFEQKHKSNESTKVYIDELFWRDFNRYWCMFHGNKMFSEYGIYNREYYAWKTDMETIRRWRQGMSGMPLVDSLMREMNETGFMPNRGRMVVACYLTMDLKQDWRFGAHYFEEKLIDHDVTSNYGGWCGSSGIGPGRVLVFNSLLQSTKFDPQGEYIRKWCPELEKMPNDFVHDPWNMPKELQKSLKIHIGDKSSAPSGFTSYPEPIKCDKYISEDAARKMKRSKPDAKPRAQSAAPGRQSTLGSFVSAGAPLKQTIK